MERSRPRDAAVRALTLLGPALLPILLASFPLLSLFQHNETDVELGVLWPPLGVCVAAALGLYLASLLVFKNGLKAAGVASVLVVGFFYFGTFADRVGLRDRWFLPLWIVVFVLGAVVLARTGRNLGNLALALGIAALVLVVGPVARIATYQANHPLVSTSDSRLWPDRLSKPAQPQHRPDIYVLIPDDYARLDVLRRYFHYSDAAFVAQLRKRGFAISEQVRSPYSDSEMNIAAAVNMGYLDGLAQILGRRSQDVRPVRRLIADSRSSRLLKSLGYRYVHLDSDEVTFPSGNPDVSSAVVPDSITNLWLQKTVLRAVGGPVGFDQKARDDRYRSAVRSTFSRLASVAVEPGPKFVVFHTLVPHDPYVFGAHGTVTFPNASDQALGSRAGMNYFLGQTEYVNRKLLAAVDAIRAHAKTPPVIIIQADEGFQANPDLFGESAMQQIRVKGFAALLFPGIRGTRVPLPPNTVNTMRFVFNRYFSARYKLLRSASYPEHDYPYQFQEMRVK